MGPFSWPIAVNNRYCQAEPDTLVEGSIFWFEDSPALGVTYNLDRDR